MKFKDIKDKNGIPYGDLTGQEYNGSIDVSESGITSLEGCPDVVKGDFLCVRNKGLSSLEFAPQTIEGDFKISYCRIPNLIGGPTKVLGKYYAMQSGLTSLEGAPDTVGGFFVDSNDRLKTLKFAPRTVDGMFSCSECSIENLEGSPFVVFGDYDCSYNKHLKSLKGSPKELSGSFDCIDTPNLTSLKYAPTQILGVFKCNNKPFPNGAKKEILVNMIKANQYQIDNNARLKFNDLKTDFDEYEKLSTGVKSNGFRTLLGIK